jgi:hypothetical protein
MSQLVVDFTAAVDAFNKGRTAADYGNLAQYFDQAIIMNEVDPPHRAHRTSVGVTTYLSQHQPAYQPRFWPDYTQLVETPLNSDNAIAASVDGPGLYQDSSVSGSQPFAVNYHFEFVRANTNVSWQISFASAK